MTKAVIITAQGHQDEEYVYALYRLKEAKYQVEVATQNGLVVNGKFGVPARATMSTTQLDADYFDLVVLPGGFEAPDRVRLMPEVLKFLVDMNDRGKLIAAICHAGSILISAGLVKGRTMTAYWSIEHDLRNSGADYQHKAPVVIDKNLITSPHYDYNGNFMAAVVRWVIEKEIIVARDRDYANAP